MSETPEMLPPVPENLAFGPVVLHFSKVVPGDPARGFVPYYHFRIFGNGGDIGHINLRVGDTEHVRFCAGHVGFEIEESHRGHWYAFCACRALAPFAHVICREVIITCDPENQASKRTIELLEAVFIDEVPVSTHDPHYARGSRTKLRFHWLID
jgi:predicted acetyltransferase